MRWFIRIIWVTFVLTQFVCCRAEDKSKEYLDSLGIYESPTDMKVRGELFPNSRLFQNLNQVWIFDEMIPDELSKTLNYRPIKDKLKRLGISCIDREKALKCDSAHVTFQCSEYSNRTGKYFMTVEDVISLKRQPREKYRLVWWCMLIEAKTPQEGLNKLSDKLISDITSARKLYK